MREIRQSGSVGGETPRRLPYLNHTSDEQVHAKLGRFMRFLFTAVRTAGVPARSAPIINYSACASVSLS